MTVHDVPDTACPPGDDYGVPMGALYLSLLRGSRRGHGSMAALRAAVAAESPDDAVRNMERALLVARVWDGVGMDAMYYHERATDG